MANSNQTTIKMTVTNTGNLQLSAYYVEGLGFSASLGGLQNHGYTEADWGKLDQVAEYLMVPTDKVKPFSVDLDNGLTLAVDERIPS